MSYICKCGKNIDNAQSLNAHFRWCLIHRTGKPVVPPPNKGKTSPFKGISLEDQVGKQRADEIKRKLSKKAKQQVYSANTRTKLSLSRIKVLERSPHIMWYCVDGIKVQGTWEKIIAEKLSANNIKFERKRIKYDNVRHYTPDFYLPDFNVFLEIKGWLRESDIIKYKKFLSEHKDKIIKVIYGKENVWNFDCSKIPELPNLKDLILPK